MIYFKTLKKVFFFAAIALCISHIPLNTYAAEGIATGKYGVNQVFDCQRNPAYPTAGSDFRLSGFKAPYTDDFDAYDIGAGYIQFFYTGNPDGPHVGIKLYSQAGAELETISAGGNIYGLEEDGFLYVSSNGGYGTFVTNAAAYEYAADNPDNSSITYTPTNGDGTSGGFVSLAALQAYNASTTVLSVEGSSFLSAAQNRSNNKAMAAASALDSFVSSGNDSGFQTAFDNLSTDAQRSDAVTQTLPVMTGATTTATLNTMGNVAQVINARNGFNSGLSSGNGFIVDGNMWFKPFYSFSDQNNTKGITGYHTDGYGSVVGIDTVVGKDWRIGIAASYAYTKVKGNDSKHKVDVNSYALTTYGSYAIDSKTEVNFQLGAGYNQNKSRRIIIFGGLDRAANAKYNSYSAQAGIGIGHVIDLTSKTKIVPTARIDYAHINNESYTETGAGSLNLVMDDQKTDQLIPEVGGKMRHSISESLSIEGYGRLGYDILTDKSSVTSTYVGGGSKFKTSNVKPSVWRLRSGAEVEYAHGDRIDFSINYDREDRGSAYKNQTASLKLTVTL